MSSTDTITLEKDGPVAVVTLNRPGRRNALNDVMWDALAQTLADLRDDPPRVVILTGAGQAFCAGYDIRPDNPITMEFFNHMQRGDGEGIGAILTRLKGILSGIEELPVPTIAAFNGDAHGGGVELALCCDLRVMDEAAILCMAETRIGMIPDLGGTVRMVRLVGRARAMDLIWTARDLGAAEALEMGLVNRVASPGRALDEAMDLASMMARNGPAALRAVKQVVRATGDLGPSLAAETAAAVECILSGENVEGVTAWMQKRPARWPE